MLKDLKIRSKLLLMVSVPIIGLLFFAGLEVQNKYLKRQNLQQTVTLTGLAVHTGALVHELQKERGLSSGFINAKGEKFKDELTKQREAVNTAVTKVADYLSAHGTTLGAVKKQLDAAEVFKGKLQETRSAVDNLKIEGKDSFGFYTGLILNYLNVVGAVATYSEDYTIMRDATAYYAFTKLKEENGKERATLNAVIAANNFNPETYQRTFAILAAQRTYLELFRTYATERDARAYDEKAASPAFQKVDELRKTVLDKGMAGEFGLTPEEWFKTITAKIDTMKEIEDLLAKDIIAMADGLAAQAQRRLLFSIALTAILGSLALFLSLVIMRGITAPLQRMLVMLQDIAQGEGDLTSRLAEDRKDELGDVAHWFNRFVANLHGIISQVSSTTMLVASASNQLHGTAEQIATAAEEVAAQSTTVATASEEMSATSNDISQNCTMAADIANRASEMAHGGASVVQETIAGMQAIADKVRESAHTVEALGARSDQIGAIVGTIEDIADQTNLLALNAAIEAARAGEMGRGFAVVADEVRALAERTTRATREIGEMIKAIQQDTGGAVASMELGVQEVEKGMDSSRRSGDALQQILEGINDVTMQVHQIATAAEEQTAVTGEISTNIHQITDVVQQTANGAHETADAASALSNMARQLEALVGKFKL